MPVSARTIDLAGPPRRMGRDFGEHLREDVRRFAEIRLNRCVDKLRELGLPVDADLVLDVCRRSIEPHRQYDAAVWDELHGIAEGANLSDEMILICNGLTDLKDAVQAAAGGGPSSGPADTAGCTAWLAAPEATEADRVLAGQTWDMHAAAADFLVVVRRKPDRGPATISMTTAGCLSLVGINSAGIAVGNNNLRPTDARPGVMYLAMIHKALGSSHLGAAVNAITQAQRCSGHNYYLAGPGGEIADIETTAGQSEVIQPAGATYAHTNHYLVDRLRALEMPGAVTASSTWRLTRMLHVLSEQAGAISPRSMIAAMCDSSGQASCRICRNDRADEAPTCGAVVMSPQDRRIWICAQPPRPEGFIELAL